MRLVLATKNKHKIGEIQKILCEKAPYISLESLDEEVAWEENGNSFVENAVIKAQAFAAKTDQPILSEDSGLVVSVLNGAPGIYSARYAGETASSEENNQKLLQDMKIFRNRKAVFQCHLVYLNKARQKFYFSGTCAGHIARNICGSEGFGYDPIFLIKNHKKTIAELSLEEKNSLSHRGQALHSWLKWLERTQNHV